jgi:hypothetical protein
MSSLPFSNYDHTTHFIGVETLDVTGKLQATPYKLWIYLCMEQQR